MHRFSIFLKSELNIFEIFIVSGKIPLAVVDTLRFENVGRGAGGGEGGSCGDAH